MKSLKELIKAARKMAEDQTHITESNPKAWYPEITLGATVGQILWVNVDKQLEMVTCWLKVKIVNDYSSKTFRVAFEPLLSAMQPKPVRLDSNFYPDDTLLDNLTGFKHNFGGKTAIFRRDSKTGPRFNLESPINPQIAAHALHVIPSVEHDVCESDGDIAVINRTIFHIGEPVNSYMDKYDCYIRTYNKLSWVEPSDEQPVLENGELGGSDREEAFFRASSTGWQTIIVPTIWVRNKGDYEIFLDFAANWRSSKYGDRITGRVGSFIVAHELKRSGKLITTTSLRASDSVWQPQSRMYVS